MISSGVEESLALIRPPHPSGKKKKKVRGIGG